jgi:hypothetical protein
VPWIQFGLLPVVIICGVGCLVVIAGDLNVIKWGLLKERESSEALSQPPDHNKFREFRPRWRRLLRGIAMATARSIETLFVEWAPSVWRRQ